ncbi:bile acid-CoA:amino acid N-acyltransferase-like isoform X2 [Polypterus senegalus]|nr:bile acid-CoA:amino acid N-acyltransferase-like isoform X2 [Polypterus senegalus]
MEAKYILPKITVQPTRGLVDEMFYIAVSNISPHQEVTIRSFLQSDDKDFWHAYAYYVSDNSGVVNVAEDNSLGGSYTGREPTGLIWSLKPVPGGRTALRLRKTEIFTPFVINISVYKGHIKGDFKEETALACAVMERWYVTPGVSRIEVKENGIYGALFLPPGPGPFPGLLDLWGGGGGLVEYRSALLASHGYATLALEYLSSKTEFSKIGEKYFEAAFGYLESHPQVTREHVGIFGLCFGASVTLSVAANENKINPKCLVCVSGTHVIRIGESIDKAFADLKLNEEKTRFDENNHIIWRELALPIPTDPNKKVNVGNLKCPLLLIAGSDDQNWPTPESAEDIEKMMKEAGNGHLLTKIIYPKTGHLIEPPYSPHIRFSNFVDLHTRKKGKAKWYSININI